MGPILLHRLLQRFGGDPAAVLQASVEHLLEVRGVGPVTAAAIRAWHTHFDLRAEEARILTSGLTVTTWEDSDYPASLREMPDPPIALYVRGTPPIAEHTAVAVVGTRSPSPYGARVARTLATELARANVSIVSGLARGVDAAAHQGALEAGGRTFGVIGSGMATVFPPEHLDLYRSVAESGAVLSEFPFQRPPDKQTFPIRNRVIAGLCRAVVVVESTGTGGAMITANFAADYGRLVYAVPGRIDEPRAEGPHRLIRDGATLCRTTDDVLADLIPKTRRATQELLDLPTNAPAEDTRLAALRDPEQRSVAMALSASASASVDELSERLSMPVAALLTHLLHLELEGLAVRRADARYERT